MPPRRAAEGFDPNALVGTSGVTAVPAVSATHTNGGVAVAAESDSGDGVFAVTASSRHTAVFGRNNAANRANSPESESES